MADNPANNGTSNDNNDSNNTVTVQDERKLMKEVGYKMQVAGDTWYPISKKWYDSWKNYTCFDKGDDDVPGGVDNLHERGIPRPGKIDNSELQGILLLYINILYITILLYILCFCLVKRDIAWNLIYNIMLDRMEYVFLIIYNLDENQEAALKKTIQENLTHIWIHEDKWNLLFKWYGGGPVFPRKVYEKGGYRKETYICKDPKLIKIITVDPKTGDIDENKCETSVVGFPRDYSFKQIAKDVCIELILRINDIIISISAIYRRLLFIYYIIYYYNNIIIV